MGKTNNDFMSTEEREYGSSNKQLNMQLKWIN